METKDYKHLCLILMLLIVFYPFLKGFGQNSHKLNKADKIFQMESPLPGGIISYSGVGDSIIDVFVHDPNAEVRVIVQLQSPPLANYMSERGTIRKEGYELARENIILEQNNFRLALKMLEGGFRDEEHPDRLPAEINIHRAYQVVLNGMAISTRQWVVEEFSTLPDFLSVHKDQEVHALLDESVAHIGAEVIWTDYDVTGEGIVVGILDTGIDYMHPDLGGGIGEGFKVKGGYNFVINTDDPMDDHSHGTHVAGIVAANGVLKGVAPDAGLMAYKVLDQQGSGFSSWIIGGIEQSVIDGIHILNASLGGPGDPEDPMSFAIDNASNAGVLCVIAAGNSGPGYSSIDSPGCARNALTVGATDLVDEIAWFSSRGPESKYQAVKPDMVAPGVQTLAPVLSGQYARYSGTSMATPHVAGAAALLLEQYPGLNPSQVKSIFSHTALDLGYDLWTQGLGRIDLISAFELPEIIVEPPALSFGAVNLLDDIWTATGEIAVTNIAAESKTINLSIAGSFPEGAVLTISPEEVILQSQETQDITLSLMVDNALVPFPVWFPSSFTESIQLAVGENLTKVPVTFLKSNALKLLFDEAPLWVIVSGDQYFSGFIEFPGLEVILMVPPGLYDMVVQYHDYNTTLLKEDVEVDSLTILSIAKAEAKNRVVSHNVDEYEKPIIPQSGHEEYYTPSFFVGKLYWTPFYLEKQLSDFNKFNWFWTGTYSSDNNTKVYLMGDQLNTCSTDVFFTYEPSALKKIAFKYPNLATDRSIFSVTALKFGSWTSWEWNPYGLPFLYPFTQTFYISPNYKYNNNRFSFFNEAFDFTGHPFEPSYENMQHMSANFSIDDYEQLFGFRHFFNRQHYSTETNRIALNGEVYKTELAPPVWGGALWMGVDRIILDNLVFLSQMKDYKYTEYLPYRLFRNGVLTSSGNFFDDMISNPWGSWYTGWAGELMLEPDEYVLEMDLESFPIRGQNGNATARMGFDHSTSYGHIPMLQSLNILSNGQFTDFVGIGREASIEFRIKMPNDSYDPELVALEYRPGSRESWTGLNLENDGALYWSDIPDNMPEGFISLRVTVEHVSGNFLEYTVEPAFLHAPVTLPIVNTFEPEDVFASTAEINGHVAFDGGAPVTQRGMVWSLSENPSLEYHDGLSTDGSGIGSFTSHLSGLQPESVYFARAYAVNELGASYGEEVVIETSEFIPCIPEELPYAYTFEYTDSHDLPNCWTGTGINNYSVEVFQWYFFQGYSIGAGLSHQAFSHALISTPAIYTEEESFKVQFKVWPDLITLPASIEIGTMDNPDNCNTFTSVKVFEFEDLPLEPWLTLEAYFYDYRETDIHVAFKIGNIDQENASQLFIREVHIEEIALCPSPHDLFTEDVTASSAVLTWSQHGNAETWDVVWGTPGFDPDSEGTLVANIDQMYYLLEYIDQSTSYEFYVRAQCDDEVSVWSLPYRFVTECGLYAIPLLEDFDSWVLPNIHQCWSYLGENNYNVDITDHRFYSAFHSARLSAVGDSYAMLISPQFEENLTGLLLSFKTLRGNCPDNVLLYAGTISDPGDVSTFSVIDVLEVTNKHGEPWHSFEVSLADYQTDDKYFAFRINSSTSDFWTRAFVDNISLSLPMYTIDVSVLPLGAGVADGGGEYQHGQQVILTATPFKEYIFYNWTEDGQEVSDNSQYIFVADANRQLTANFTKVYPTIPETRLLEDYTIIDGEMTCFDATMSIYLSGAGGPFLVLPGGQVSLIAGYKIIMLPGTHAQQGSFLQASISLGGPFCDEIDPHFLLADKSMGTDAKDSGITSAGNDSAASDLLFRVYPNPTKSHFTIELIAHDDGCGFVAEVYDTHGRLVKRKDLLLGEKQYMFSLEGQKPGIYLVRVVQGVQTATERVVKQ